MPLVWRNRERLSAWSAASLAAIGVMAVLHAPSTGAEVRAGQPPPIPPAFALRATNGYSISGFAAQPYRGKPGFLFLFVRDRRSEALYWTRIAPIAEGEIHADLGALGFVDLQFHPSERIASESACGGKPVTFQEGVYEGMIRFDGEEGFTRASATRVKADLGPLLRLGCVGVHGGWSSPGPGAGLSIRRRSARFSVALEAMTNGPPGPARFAARIDERRNGMAISRFVEAVGSSSSFDYDRQGDVRASVRPRPSPEKGAFTARRAEQIAGSAPCRSISLADQTLRLREPPSRRGSNAGASSGVPRSEVLRAR